MIGGIHYHPAWNDGALEKAAYLVGLRIQRGHLVSARRSTSTEAPFNSPSLPRRTSLPSDRLAFAPEWRPVMMRGFRRGGMVAATFPGPPHSRLNRAANRRRRATPGARAPR